MLRLLSAFFSLLDRIGKYFADRQLMDAGRAEQAVEAVHEVETRVEAADRAIAVPDAARTERLRNKYDRSRR
jgi:hypothetical protein